MRKVRVQDAVGLVLAHDVTEVVPGKKKGVAFERGRVIKEGDIERFLDLGKNHVYVLDGNEKDVHENEAGRRIAESISARNAEVLHAKEGTVRILSLVSGIVRINARHLSEINRIRDIIFTTLPDYYPVKPGETIAATKILPLYIPEERLQQAETVGRKGIIDVRPYRLTKAGLVVTGTEVATGRIPDASPKVEEKLKEYGLTIVGKQLAPDNVELVRDAVLSMVEKGAELVVTTGGLSVDADDVTREGIEATGATLITYGAPVFPGAMSVVARLKGRYILGAPAGIFHSRCTFLDIVVPRIMAGERITATTVRKFAVGGLCAKCADCSYPACYFGRG